MKSKYTIFLLCFLAVILLAIGFGIKNPPEKLKATDISLIHSISVHSVHNPNEQKFRLTEAEINYWKSLEFDIANNISLGATPDFIIKLNGRDTKFSAMYNQDSDVVFFSFIPEVEYGFLNSPTPGGWTRPLYTSLADERLLSLLRIK